MARPAPSQRKSRAQTRAEDRLAAVRNGTTRRSSPKRRLAEVPQVFQDMLSEVASSDADDVVRDRPSKKRRLDLTSDDLETTAALERTLPSGSNIEEPSLPQQTIINSDEDDEDDEDDFDWEEVAVDPNDPSSANSAKHVAEDEVGDISIEVGPRNTPKRVLAKRKPATTAERQFRLAVHKTNLLFILFHVHVRNAWCNLEAVQSKLRSFLPTKIVGMLHPPQTLIQFGRSDQFLQGLRLAVDAWNARFKVTGSGMWKPLWADSSEEIKQQLDAASEQLQLIDKAQFVKVTSTLSGSQDLGNQLFCALLRSVGVEARLVCSMQPLPFGTAGAKLPTPTHSKPTFYANPRSAEATSADEGSLTGSASEGPGSKAPKGRRRRIGQPSLAIAGTSQLPPTVEKKRPKKIMRTLEYPIFWVEAFNSAYQLWVPVDAVVTGTIGKPAKLEPPASYTLNTLSYVVAFDEHSYARDVTRRYAKAYNAKTRKLRVESTGNGERWWRKALKPFRPYTMPDHYQVEDAELANKEAQEGLPNNVQDFKNHPYYALERHLKRHEVIFPKRPVGKVNAGKTSGNKIENVYRQIDVQVVRSAEKWYRLGREIKPGEQPLKHVTARTSRDRRIDEDNDKEEPATTALYAASQTRLYIPTPVVEGKIMKNAYGNLDVYVPSMVPPGAVHIPHKLAARAAKLLGVDYADAVTGFTFKGRIGEAVKQGVIVACENGDAVESVIRGFEDVSQQAEDAKRSAESLRLWRRFLTGLRIGVRIGIYDSGGTASSSKTQALRQELEKEEAKDQDTPEAGGFFPDASEETIPTFARYRANAQPRSLLSAYQKLDDLSQSDGEETAEAIDEAAPRLRRRRKAEPELTASDSEDGYVPETARSLRSRRTQAKQKSPERQEELRIPERRNLRRNAGNQISISASEGYDEAGGFLPDVTLEEEEEEEIEEISGGGFFRGSNDNSELAKAFVLEEDDAEKTRGVEASVADDGKHNPDDHEDLHGGGFIMDAPTTADQYSTRAPSGNDDVSMLGGGFDLETVSEDNIKLPHRLDLDSYDYDLPGGKGSLEHQVEAIEDGVTDGDEPGHTRTDNMEDVATETAPMKIVDTVHGAPSVMSAHQAKHADVASEDDKDSLMSHDPEDDEAEPEWLNSD